MNDLQSVLTEGMERLQAERARLERARAVQRAHTIYLDFDGCLHDSSVWIPADREPYCDTPDRTLFEWAPILVDVLAPYPDVRIILSTSWLKLGFETARDKLPSGLRERVISATSANPEAAYASQQLTLRGEQVRVDAARRGLERWEWIAIDDDRNGWADMEDRLVLCRGGFGLSDPDVQARIRHFLEGGA